MVSSDPWPCPSWWPLHPLTSCAPWGWGASRTEVYANDQAWNDHLDMQSETPELIAQFARCPRPPCSCPAPACPVVTMPAVIIPFEH